MDDRIVSAETIVSALRERKTAGEIDEHARGDPPHRGDLRPRGGFIRPGLTEKEIAAFMHAEMRAARPRLRLGARRAARRSSPARERRRGALRPDRAARRARPRPQHGLRRQGGRLRLRHAAHVLRPRTRARRPRRRTCSRGFDTIVDCDRARPSGRCGPASRGARSTRCRAAHLIVERGLRRVPARARATRSGASPTTAPPSSDPPGRSTRSKPFRKLEPGMVFTIEPRLTGPRAAASARSRRWCSSPRTGCEWLSAPQTELLLVG